MTAADDTDTSPVPPKKLSLKEVAARFEAGDADVLEVCQHAAISNSVHNIHGTARSRDNGSAC